MQIDVSELEKVVKIGFELAGDKSIDWVRECILQFADQTRNIFSDPDHWDYVATIAKALLERKTLTSLEVSDLLQLENDWTELGEEI